MLQRSMKNLGQEIQSENAFVFQTRDSFSHPIIEEIDNLMRKLSFPRLVGTEANAKAENLLISIFEKINLKLKKYPFEGTFFYSTTLIRLVVITQILFNLGFLHIIHFFPEFWIFLLILFLISLVYLMKTIKKIHLPIVGKKFRANNLFGKISSPLPLSHTSSSSKKTVLLVAHLDSKSQRLTTLHRAISAFLISLSSILALILFFIMWSLHIISHYFPSFLSPNIFLPLKEDLFRITFILVVISVISGIPLIINDIENKSPGCIDNASGVCSLYALTSLINKELENPKSPLHHLNIYVLISNAEEVTTFGVRQFYSVLVENHLIPLKKKIQFKKKKRLPAIYAINFDMVGYVEKTIRKTPPQNKNENSKPYTIEFLEKFGFPKPKKTSPFLSSLLTELSSPLKKNFNIHLNGFTLPIGANTDGNILRGFGIETIDFIEHKAGSITHTPKDRYEGNEGEGASYKEKIFDPAHAFLYSRTVIELLKILSHSSEPYCLQKHT